MKQSDAAHEYDLVQDMMKLHVPESWRYLNPIMEGNSKHSALVAAWLTPSPGTATQRVRLHLLPHDRVRALAIRQSHEAAPTHRCQVMMLLAHPNSALYNCLIRTHHITSRKKLQRVRRAAEQFGLYSLLIRSGGCPGIMFAETKDQGALQAWVTAVQALRYKDFRCLAKPSPTVATRMIQPKQGLVFEETESMQYFAERLNDKGLGSWYTGLMFG
ncbi:hypothetical protein LIA77_05143 [Sarocladium implicatum]|nr:hypothetical protein LIA77_05143 [Sarocladium implicatum]